MKPRCPHILVFLTIFFLNCYNNQDFARPQDLYQLNIEVSGAIPKHKKIKATIHQNLGSRIKSFEGSIERRGGYSIGFPKHSYEIDLKKDFPLSGLPADDDWILNANYIDKTFLRHVICYELFQDMNPNNQVAQHKYIELAFNYKYKGLYVLMEKLDKSSLNINGKDPTSVIFKEPHIFRKSYDNIKFRDADNIHQQTFPKDKNKSNYIESIRQFILTSDEASFEKEFPKVFDLENILDWHLLLLMSNNNDGILKNFYLYKVNALTPLRIAPWDYDHSFGRDGDNELNLNERPMEIERSVLFTRLLKYPWYKKRLKQKWNHYNANNILSKQGLKQMIIYKAQSVKPYVEKNFEVWSIYNSIYYDGNDFDAEINIMLRFVEIRHKYLSTYFALL